MGMTDNLEKMLAKGRDDAMLRFGLGSAYFNDRAYDRAVPHLEACIAHDADYSAAYKLLGRSLLKLGQTEQAAAVFDQGLQAARRQGDKQTEKEITVFRQRMTRESND
ncbi:MAG: tetratricopeptide repeat protein [Proteobacteria bacterium]|nr:tetratricopeptide repeat protein [Pseudomonadota bacterium]